MSKIQRETLPYGKVISLKVAGVNRDNISRLKKSDFLFKRSFDFIVSLLVITLVLSWLIPILALLIKLDSRGPVFFVQKRVGALGKVFHCYKLRTMYVNSEANIRQAQENDPRITRLGKFLRLSCLDELPQFINVFLGSMSIVGPRPHMIKDCWEFSKIIKHYNAREFLKPGITGMAQVKGCRGRTNDLYDVIHRYKWDMFYVKNCSFRLDMKIMNLTFMNIISAFFAILNPASVKEQEENKIYSLDTPEFLN